MAKSRTCAVGALPAAPGSSATRLVDAALSPPTTPDWPIRVENGGGTASLPADQSTNVPSGSIGKADDWHPHSPILGGTAPREVETRPMTSSGRPEAGPMSAAGRRAENTFRPMSAAGRRGGAAGTVGRRGGGGRRAAPPL